MRALSVCTVVTLSPNDAQAGKASASNKLGSNRRTVFPFGNPKGAGRFIVCPLMALPTNTRRNLAAWQGRLTDSPRILFHFTGIAAMTGLRYKRVSMAIVSQGVSAHASPSLFTGLGLCAPGRSNVLECHNRL